MVEEKIKNDDNQNEKVTGVIKKNKRNIKLFNYLIAKIFNIIFTTIIFIGLLYLGIMMICSINNINMKFTKYFYSPPITKSNITCNKKGILYNCKLNYEIKPKYDENEIAKMMDEYINEYYSLTESNIEYDDFINGKMQKIYSEISAQNTSYAITYKIPFKINKIDSLYCENNQYNSCSNFKYFVKFTKIDEPNYSDPLIFYIFLILTILLIILVVILGIGSLIQIIKYISFVIHSEYYINVPCKLKKSKSYLDHYMVEIDYTLPNGKHIHKKRKVESKNEFETCQVLMNGLFTSIEREFKIKKRHYD